MDVPAPTSAAFDLETVYLRHHRLVQWIVRAAGIPEAAVDDVTHDVFVAIHRRRAAFTHGDLRKWIVGVTRSVCHGHRRAHARAQRRLGRLPDPASPPTPEELASQRHELRRLQRALDALDPAQREAFVYIELEGLTAAETSARVGAKVATVSSRLRLARQRVGIALGLDGQPGARTHAEGDDARARRAWAVIAARIAAEPTVPASVGPSAGFGGWVGGAAIGATVGAALVGALVWVRAPEREASPRPAVAPSEARPGEVTTVSVAARPDPVAVAATPLGSGDPPAHVPTASTARPTMRLGRPATAEPEPTAPTLPPAEPPAPQVPAGLAAEAKLLRLAAQRLDAGRPDLAANALDEHARQFPAGDLAAERERLRARLPPSR